MNISHASTGYELRFRSLFDPGRAYVFPCDAEGHVDMDSLSERARHNYLHARSVIGRDLCVPAVQPSQEPCPVPGEPGQEATLGESATWRTVGGAGGLER